MRSYFYSLASLFTVFCFNITFLFAQNLESGSLSGTVSDEGGKPLNGAYIFIHDVKVLAISDSIGLYKTTSVNAGKYLVEVSFQGYATSLQQVFITGNLTKNFILHSTAIEQESVTVTGLSSATRLKHSPQSISVVKRTELLQNASSNLMSALARKAGISVITTGPAISKPVIRGLGYNRVVTVNDGIRQEGQQWGDEHGIEIDELSVQKAEILKGPASLVYGSDAMAGVINIVTNQPASPGTVKANILSSYNTNNNSRGDYVNVAGNLSNGFNWNVYGSNKTAFDYRNKLDGYVLNSRFNERNFGGYIGINKAWGYSHIIVSSFNQKLGVPEGVRDSATGKFIIFAETPFASIATTEQLQSKDFVTPYQQINHFKIASDNSISIGRNRLVATIAYQRNQRREFADPTQPNLPGLHFDLPTINYNFQLQLAQMGGWKTTFGFNGMYQQNKNLADEKLIPEYHLFDAGIFGFTTKTFDKLTFSGGIRVDLRNMETKSLKEMGSDKFVGISRQFKNISGSAGFTYEASSRVTLKANVAKGYRAPNAAELSSNGAHEGTYRYEYGESNLKVENSYQLDAGVEVATNHVSFGISTFYNYINNYIFYQRLQANSGGDSLLTIDGTDLQAFKYNQASASLLGFEANLDIHPHPLDWLHIENTLSFVAGSFSNPISGSSHLPAMPPFRLLTEVRGSFLKMGKCFQNLYGKVEMEATAKQNNIFSAYNTETVTNGYQLFNLGAGTDIAYRHKTICSIYLSMNNITNISYQNHLSRLKYTDTNNATGNRGIYNMGRNFNIKINIPINIKS